MLAITAHHSAHGFRSIGRDGSPPLRTRDASRLARPRVNGAERQRPVRLALPPGSAQRLGRTPARWLRCERGLPAVDSRRPRPPDRPTTVKDQEMGMPAWATDPSSMLITEADYPAKAVPAAGLRPWDVKPGGAPGWLAPDRTAFVRLGPLRPALVRSAPVRSMRGTSRPGRSVRP